MLKALKKIFGKAPDERAGIPTGAPSATTERQPDPVTQPGATDETQSKPQPSQRSADKPRRQRSSKPPKPAAPAWKLEDFVVEPAEGKTDEDAVRAMTDFIRTGLDGLKRQVEGGS